MSQSRHYSPLLLPALSIALLLVLNITLRFLYHADQNTSQTFDEVSAQPDNRNLKWPDSNLGFSYNELLSVESLTSNQYTLIP